MSAEGVPTCGGGATRLGGGCRAVARYPSPPSLLCFSPSRSWWPAGGPGGRDKTLEQIVLGSTGIVFNQAAQIWNHTFYWNGLRPNPSGQANPPTGPVKALIERDFGSVAAFQEQFTNTRGAAQPRLADHNLHSATQPWIGVVLLPSGHSSLAGLCVVHFSAGLLLMSKSVIYVEICPILRHFGLCLGHIWAALGHFGFYAF